MAEKGKKTYEIKNHGIKNNYFISTDLKRAGIAY